MSHTYLLELCESINRKVADAKESLSSEVIGESALDQAFQKGRIQILTELKQFLNDNYSEKLPNRIRKLL